MGSDCPNLTIAEIIIASQNLQKNITTLGADSSGGFYLMALSKKNYFRNVFLNFDWCSNQLFTTVASHFNTALCTTYILQNKVDVNTASRLKLILKSRLVTPFIKLLCRLFNFFDKIINLQLNFKLTLFSPNFTLRGPPCFTTFKFIFYNL